MTLTKHLPRFRFLSQILFALSALLPLQGASGAVVFSDDFSDGSASNWRPGTAWTVINNDPTGEPSAASQWLYSTTTTDFNAIQSPDASGFTATVDAFTSVRFSTGIEFITSMPNRIDLYLRTNNGNYNGGTASLDNAYGLKLTPGTGTAVRLAITKRVGGVESFIATAAADITLTSATYYRTELTIGNGGAVTAAVYDASGTLLSSVGATDTSHTTFGSVVNALRTSSGSTGFRTSNFLVETIAVPEPSVAFMAGLAPLLLMGWRRRRVSC